MTSRGSAQHSAEIIWKACDALRGRLAISESFLLLISLFVLKFLSDLSADRKEWSPAFRRKHPLWATLGLPASCDWQALVREPAGGLGRRLAAELARVEAASGRLLGGAFGWSVAERLGEVDTAVLSQAVTLISSLDLRPSVVESLEFIGIYEHLLFRFAESQGPLGEFAVPTEVAQLMACLLEPAPGESVYDPFCRSGQLLSRVARHAQRPSLVAGQAWVDQDAFFAGVNMLLCEFETTILANGDSIWSPLLAGQGELLKFDIVVSNPPFGAGRWGAERARFDPYDRFGRGIPPDSRSDYAFISHAVASLKEESGRAALVVSLGTLSRGGEEAAIRQALVQDGLVDGVIALPANLFSATKIPVAILVLKKSRAGDDVAFVDASREFSTLGGRSVLRSEAIDRIASALRTRESTPGFSRAVPLEEIASNGFSLSVPRYIEGLSGVARDLKEVWAEAEAIEEELGTVKVELDSLLRRLGLLGP